MGKFSAVSFPYVGTGDERRIQIRAETVKGHETTFVGEIPQEGGPPTIVAVLPRNVDADPENELLVLTRWDIRHPALDTNGRYYRTYAFDQLPSPCGKGLSRMEAVEQRIGEGFIGVLEGRRVSFDVTTAGAVDQALQRPPEAVDPV